MYTCIARVNILLICPAERAGNYALPVKGASIVSLYSPPAGNEKHFACANSYNDSCGVINFSDGCVGVGYNSHV